MVNQMKLVNTPRAGSFQIGVARLDISTKPTVLAHKHRISNPLDSIACPFHTKIHGLMSDIGENNKIDEFGLDRPLEA